MTWWHPCVKGLGAFARQALSGRADDLFLEFIAETNRGVGQAATQEALSLQIERSRSLGNPYLRALDVDR